MRSGYPKSIEIVSLDADLRAHPMPSETISPLATLTMSYSDLHRRPFATTYALIVTGLHRVIGEVFDPDYPVDFGPARLVLPD
jgi:hypothetical protein